MKTNITKEMGNKVTAPEAMEDNSITAQQGEDPNKS